MAEKYQTFDIIEEITRLDGTTYYELANIFMNGRAELAANRGFIKQVRILQTQHSAFECGPNLRSLH